MAQKIKGEVRMKKYCRPQRQSTLPLVIIWGAIIFFSGMLIDPSHANALTRNQVKEIVIRESMNSIVPPALALAVAKVESDFNPKALSSAGARGIMQIMPRTGRQEFGVNENELWDPRLNIQIGIDYLAQLYKQYGKRWDLALSHYNGGTLRGHGRNARPHRYTRNYVRNVQKWQRRYKEQALIWQVTNREIATLATDTYDLDRTELKTALRASLKQYRNKKNLNKSIKSNLQKSPVSRSFWSTNSSKEKIIADFDEEFYQRIKRTRAELNLLRFVPFKQKS